MDWKTNLVEKEDRLPAVIDGEEVEKLAGWWQLVGKGEH